MIQIKNDVVITAEETTKLMLDELTEMAKIAIGDDTWMINDGFASKYGFSSLDIQGVLEGKVHDMSLRDYNMLKSYLNWFIKDTGGHTPINPNEDVECEYELEIPEDGVEPNDCNARCGACGVDSCAGCCDCNNTECDNNECTCKHTNDEIDEFIENVNKNLPESCQIDHEEAIKAKEVFDEDLNKAASSDYDKAAKEANIELFGTDRDLNSLTISELKYLIYKNHWDNEFDLNMLNHRQTVLSFLYHKLEDKVVEKIHKKNNIKKDAINDFNKMKSKYIKKHKATTTDEAINEIMSLLNKYFH